jgi:FMN phosphatase YigB (HAD superfamily)
VLEAVTLGIAGVLRPRGDVWADRLAAVAEELSRRGFPGDRFRVHALERLHRSGERAVVTRTLSDLQIRLSSEEVRRLVRLSRHPVRCPAASSRQRAALGRLASRYRIAFLEAGPLETLDLYLRGLGLRDFPERCLGTAQLGRQAEPPSALAFRWLAERLELRPDECLYVAGSGSMQAAATRAGWQVLGLHEIPPVGLDRLDPEDRADILDLTDGGGSASASAPEDRGA